MRDQSREPRGLSGRAFAGHAVQRLEERPNPRLADERRERLRDVGIAAAWKPVDVEPVLGQRSFGGSRPQSAIEAALLGRHQRCRI
jgi:hypothetical protein